MRATASSSVGDPMTVVLEDICRIYPGPPSVEALRSVTLSIRSGEFVAIMGRSGSGKSTLLNILGLLDRPSSGHYLLEGEETSSLTERQRTRKRAGGIGFVFQDSCLIDHLTATENVAVGLLYCGVAARERAVRSGSVLEQVELGHRASAFASQLSGGERQRVAIARALAPSPTMLLCDEPTGNLDSATSDSILDLLQSLNDRGVTVVVITHDPLVGERANRIIRINDGIATEDS